MEAWLRQQKPNHPDKSELASINVVAEHRLTPILQFVKKIIKFGGERVSLPRNLARLQAERGETNYRLAKTIGVSQTTVKNWKDGLSRPFPKHMRLIAKHYGVTVEQLMQSQEDECNTQ